VDILQLIDRLDELLEAGVRVPLSDKVAIDEQAFMNIIDQMRITIPREIRRAKEVEAEKEQYVAQAHEEARRIIAQAREDAAKLLDEHELRIAAEERAKAITSRAEHTAVGIRRGAEEYALSELQKLDEQLTALQAVVRNGVYTLGAAHQVADAEPEAAQADDVDAPDAETEGAADAA